MTETQTQWIEQQKREQPKANVTVLTFITKILFHNGSSKEKTNDIYTLFACGYCYYFARMLEDAFPGGTICWAAPFGHITYQYDGMFYDIGGVYQGEATAQIPIDRLGDAINDFRHIPNLSYNATEQELARIQLEWEEERP